MARKSRITPDSLRTLDWQAEEYRKQMGEDAADRQIVATGHCICKRRTIKTDQGYRTVHSRHCIKWKDWMGEYIPEVTPWSTSAEAHIAAAHNAPVHKRARL